MSATIIVDCNSVCHRLKHTMGGLTHEEQEVGIIFGFLRQLLFLSRKLSSRKFIFCWDSKSTERIAVDPRYKENRRKERTEEEKRLDELVFNQFTLLREFILIGLGFRNIFWQKGIESDDLIAKITMTHPYKFIIVSTDQDLYQLLSEDVSIFTKANRPLYTVDDFRAEYRIDPGQWPLVKAIAGCATDNVIGLKGVGEKTAIKYLNAELSTSSRLFRVIEEGKEIINKNYILVSLPFPSTHPVSLIKDELTLDGYLAVCDRYKFRSLQSAGSTSEWKELFIR